MTTDKLDIALSIVIPAYNARPYLAEGLLQLVTRVNDRIEILVVDDGSTDGSGDQARAILNRDSSARHRVLTQINRGVSAARNAGLAEARGRYVLFLDSDDRLHDCFPEVFLEDLQDCEADVYAWGCRVLVEGQLMPVDTILEILWEDTTGRELLEDIIIHHRRWYPSTGTLAFRREFLKNHGLSYVEGCACGEDQELNFKALSFAQQVRRTDVPLFYYLKRSGSVMRSCDWGRFDVIAALKRVEAHFLSLDTPWATAMAAEIGGPRIVSNFFLNLKSCYRQAKAPEPRAWLAELYQKVPELEGIIQPLLVECSGLDRRLRWEAHLFRLAPHLYLQWAGKRKVEEKRDVR